MKKYQTESMNLELETDRLNNPISKKVNAYLCEKWILKSRYTMTKFQMNLNQIDQIKGFKHFNEYIEVLQVDFIALIEQNLVNMFYESEMEGKGDSAIGNFIKNKLKVNKE